jgi:hypothetical protein
MIHYNEGYTPKVPRAATPGAVYDAMYAIAYAAFALGDAPVTGRGLAAMLPHIARIDADAGGPPVGIDVGPTRIFEAFAALRAGRALDLDGAATKMDFDPSTGDTPSDFAVLCVAAGTGGKAGEAVESSVVYRGGTGALDGLPLRCR